MPLVVKSGVESIVSPKRTSQIFAVDITTLETTVDFSKTIDDRSARRLFRKLEKNILTPK